HETEKRIQRYKSGSPTDVRQVVRKVCRRALARRAVHDAKQRTRRRCKSSATSLADSLRSRVIQSAAAHLVRPSVGKPCAWGSRAGGSGPPALPKPFLVRIARPAG